MKKEIAPKADYLFEVSWEVCNKVGGIYTVLKSKAATQHQLYGDKYCLIGPYVEKEAKIRFERENPPKELNKAFNELKKDKIECYFGKWPIGTKRIKTILIDFSAYMPNAQEIKKGLENDFGVDPSSSTDSTWFPKERYDIFIVWSTVAGMLLQKLRKELKGKIIAHHHEYLSAACLLYLKKNKVKIGTIFTTHATILGRTIAATGVNLYNKIKGIDPKKYAYDLKIQSRYLLELACVKNCDVFTTVSDITGVEAKYLLKRKPDVILPNGFNLDQYPPLEERAIKHNKYRRIIGHFTRTYFSPYYQVNLYKSLFYYIIGRYEFKNKGIDVFIEALGALNKKLNAEKIQKNIIVFIAITGKVKGINSTILNNKNKYHGIEHFIERYSVDIKQTLIESVINRTIPTSKQLFTNDFRYDIKKKMIEFKRTGLPPVVTHDLLYPDKDLIIKHLKKFGLNNSKKDRVKVIYYPGYLSEADGLINLGYNDFVMGCHLGVFPSCYEPWGYTPVEAGACGVPFITTDLAGFGKHLIKDDPKNSFFVLRRLNKTHNAVVKQLTKQLYDFATINTGQRVEMKLKAKKIVADTDWSKMIEYYIKAHNLALSKIR